MHKSPYALHKRGLQLFKSKFAQMVILLSLFYIVYSCDSDSEIAELRTAVSTGDSVQKADLLKYFISNHSKSDSISEAYSVYLNTLYYDLDRKYEALSLFSSMLDHKESDIILEKALYFLNYAKLQDSLRALSETDSLLKVFPQDKFKIKWSLYLFHICSELMLEDSIKCQIFSDLSSEIVTSDIPNCTEFIALSDLITEICDSASLEVSNQFLRKAIEVNTVRNAIKVRPDIADTSDIRLFRHKQNYGIYLRLAWNAYRTERYIQAMHLISQSSKYYDISFGNGLILLGAIQAENDELEKGWDNLLKGLLIDEMAETTSSEIKDMYSELYRRVMKKGSPERYLANYRSQNRKN